MNLNRVVAIEEKYAAALLKNSQGNYEECGRLMLVEFQNSSRGAQKKRILALRKAAFYFVKAEKLEDFREWWSNLSAADRSTVSADTAVQIDNIISHKSYVEHFHKCYIFSDTYNIWYKNITAD